MINDKNVVRCMNCAKYFLKLNEFSILCKDCYKNIWECDEKWIKPSKI